MKRMISMLILVVTLVSLLVGCGSFTCDLCGKESDGDKHEIELFGVEMVYCDDCFGG